MDAMKQETSPILTLSTIIQKYYMQYGNMRILAYYIDNQFEKWLSL